MTTEPPLAGQTLEHYLDALASSQPAPGGGSAAAISAALAAALGEMVCAVTLARREAQHRSELEQLQASVAALRGRFLQLAADDETAFGEYAAAVRLPKTSQTEKQDRRNAMQHALASAAAVPLALAEACVELLNLLADIARLGSRSVVSDAQTGAYLTQAAINAAALNLKANANLLSERTAGTALITRFEAMTTNVAAQVQAVDEAASAN